MFTKKKEDYYSHAILVIVFGKVERIKPICLSQFLRGRNIVYFMRPYGSKAFRSHFIRANALIM